MIDTNYAAYVSAGNLISVYAPPGPQLQAQHVIDRHEIHLLEFDKNTAIRIEPIPYTRTLYYGPDSDSWPISQLTHAILSDDGEHRAELDPMVKDMYEERGTTGRYKPIEMKRGENTDHGYDAYLDAMRAVNDRYGDIISVDDLIDPAQGHFSVGSIRRLLTGISSDDEDGA